MLWDLLICPRVQLEGMVSCNIRSFSSLNLIFSFQGSVNFVLTQPV